MIMAEDAQGMDTSSTEAKPSSSDVEMGEASATGDGGGSDAPSAPAAAAADAVKLTLKGTWKGTVLISLSVEVRELKRMITAASEGKLPEGRVKLVVKGKTLNDSVTLSAAGITAKSKIMCMRGAPPSGVEEKEPGPASAKDDTPAVVKRELCKGHCGFYGDDQFKGHCWKCFQTNYADEAAEIIAAKEAAKGRQAEEDGAAAQWEFLADGSMGWRTMSDGVVKLLEASRKKDTSIIRFQNKGIDPRRRSKVRDGGGGICLLRTCVDHRF